MSPARAAPGPVTAPIAAVAPPEPVAANGAPPVAPPGAPQPIAPPATDKPRGFWGNWGNLFKKRK